MVISASWSIWRQSNSTRAAAIMAMILDDSWWDRTKYLLRFIEPILGMVRYIDIDRPCLGEVYDGIESMFEDIKKIINEREQDPEDKFFKELQIIMVERWYKMTTPLHLLAFALSPRFYSQLVFRESTTRVTPDKDLEVAHGYKAALQILFPEHIRPTVRFEFMSFTSTDDCSLDALEDKNNFDAHKWWYFHGQMYQQLQPVAIKILSQVASSSSSKRNWSTYSFIHSIKHNRLNSKKADNLIFVHSNLRLTTHKENAYKKGDARHWDVEPERAELEDSIAHFGALALEDDDHKLPSDVEADPEVEPDIASTNASGTFCASNPQQQNGDDLFDDF